MNLLILKEILDLYIGLRPDKYPPRSEEEKKLKSMKYSQLKQNLCLFYTRNKALVRKTLRANEFFTSNDNGKSSYKYFSYY